MWAQVVSAILGLWLMAAPGIFSYGSSASDNGHIVGPIIVTFAVVAWWEATRVMRKWNYPLALWLLLAPWILGYESNVAIASDMICGVLILILSSVKGKIEHTFGGGWSSLWKKNPEHLQNSDS